MTFNQGHYYHIYNRGCIGKQKRKILDNDFIYQRNGSFSEYECNKSFEKEMGVYLFDKEKTLV